ncbi:hypothetical protein H671_6g17004 [Cricetulus griseus]|nr:hypothetical protein H671_6g17004 [Cricetulus griseus]
MCFYLALFSSFLLGVGSARVCWIPLGWGGGWTQNCPWASACQILPLNSDHGPADGGRTVTGPRHVGACSRTRIQCTDHWCQMTVSIDDKWNRKQPLAYLGQWMDAELPLGLRMLDPAAELGSGTQITHECDLIQGHGISRDPDLGRTEEESHDPDTCSRTLVVHKDDVKNQEILHEEQIYWSVKIVLEF